MPRGLHPPLASSSTTSRPKPSPTREQQRANAWDKAAQSNIVAFLSRDLRTKHASSPRKGPATATQEKVLAAECSPDSPAGLLDGLLGANEDANKEVAAASLSSDIVVLIGLTAAMSCICSVDRSAMSVAILPSLLTPAPNKIQLLLHTWLFLCTVALCFATP
jgi:hypothetical protein